MGVFGNTFGNTFGGQQGALLNQIIPEYKAVMAAMTTQPLSQDKINQNIWMRQMISKGYYAKAEILDMMSVHSGGGLVNWAKPGTFNPSLINTPLFTSYMGYKGDTAGGKMLNSNFNPATQGTKIGKDNICVIIGIGDDIGQDKPDFGANDGTNYLNIQAKTLSSDLFYAVLNSDGGSTVPSVDGKGHFAVSRGNSANMDMYVNMLLTNVSRNSTGLVNKNLGIAGRRENNAYWDASNRTIRYAFIFSYLTEPEVRDVISITENYLKKYNADLIGGFNRGKIAFTFDDGRPSNYTVGNEIFKARNKKATYFINGGTISANIGQDFMTWPQLVEMHSQGNDIQCHEYNHVDPTTITPEQLATLYVSNNDAFISHGLPAPLHTAYVGGGNNASVQNTASLYRQSGCNTFEQFNKVRTPHYQINRINSDTINDAKMMRLKQMIDAVSMSKEALIFYSHIVSNREFYGEIQDTRLAELLDYAISKDVDIVTISELYSQMNA